MSMLGGYPGLASGGISHRAGLKEEDEEENVHDLSDDIDVETDLEPPRLVKYNENCFNEAAMNCMEKIPHGPLPHSDSLTFTLV